MVNIGAVQNDVTVKEVKGFFKSNKNCGKDDGGSKDYYTLCDAMYE